MDRSGKEGSGKLRQPKGWSGAQPVLERQKDEKILDPDVPALFAYLFGCRNWRRAPTANETESKRWNVENGRQLLEYAVENSDPGSKVHVLATDRLKRGPASGTAGDSNRLGR
jgi:hypothetical protein